MKAKSISGINIGKGHDKSSLGDIFGSLIKGKNKGTIARVHVLSDRAASLTVQVSYSDLKSDAERTISASATDDKGHPIRDIKAGRASITGTQGDVTLTLEIASDAAPGTTINQSSLQIQIAKGNNALKPEVLSEFQCIKQWKSTSTSIVAEPIGKSRTLPATKPVSAGGPRLIPIHPFKIHPASTAGTNKPLTEVAVQAGPTMAASHSSMNNATPNAVTMHTLNPNFAQLAMVRNVAGLPTAVKDNNGRGPGANYLRLFDGIEMEPNVSAEGLTNLHPNIYVDDNPASGFYYYLPAKYSLYWDADAGYALKILYGAAATEDAANPVTVSARLTTGITNSDVTLATAILKDYCRDNTLTFKELRPFPFSNMAISLKNDVAGQYSIPPEKISVTGITDIAGLIDFSLATDPVTKENLQLVLTQGLGINGQVTYQSASDAGAGGLQVTIPLRLKFADLASFGDKTYARDAAFQNPTPFSQRLKFVNVLLDSDKPTVYSYDLGDTEIPAGGKISIDGSKIPAWVDASAKRMWVEYSVVGDDAQANQKALDASIGGVSSVAQAEITFRTLTPLQDTGAALIVVTVSSKYFDPKGQTESTKTLELSKDGETYKIKPVYLVNRQADEVKPNDPLFKFKITVVQADGTSVESTQWTSSSGSTVYIGKAQIQPLLGAPPAVPDKPATPDKPVTPDKPKDGGA